MSGEGPKLLSRFCIFSTSSNAFLYALFAFVKFSNKAGLSFN